MFTTLLVLHIVGVALWLGGNAVLAFVGPRTSEASAEVRAWWADTQGAMARALYNAAGVLVLITGIALVVRDGSAFKFSNTFVSIGFAAVIIGAVLGMAVFGPGTRKLAAAVRSGDAADEKALTSKLTAFGILDTVVVVVTIVAMVGQWGVGN